MPPKNKHGQADVNGEDSSRSNGYTQNNGESSSNRRHKGNSQEAQTSPALGQYTEHARQTIEKMRSAQKAMHDLSEQFRIHESEIQDIPKNQEKIAELEEECRNKDEVIRDHKGMNAILKQEKHAAEQEFILKEEDLAKQREALEKERKALKKEKNTLDKRVVVQEAEYKGKIQKEFEELGIERDRDMKQKEEENKAKLVNLEDDLKIVSEEVERLQIQNQEYLKELKLTTGRCDDLEIVKTSLKKSHEEVKMTLQYLENEFALHNQKEEI
jgi:chromosome segregation ATPase